jgi:hypothetical protein
MRRRRTPEIIAGRVNADGSIAAGDGFTVAKGAAGVYTINFPSSFRLISGVGNSATASGLKAADFTISAGALVVVMFTTSTGAAADTAFTFAAYGTQQ